jgi:hypothetical protein
VADLARVILDHPVGDLRRTARQVALRSLPSLVCVVEEWGCVAVEEWRAVGDAGCGVVVVAA